MISRGRRRVFDALGGDRRAIGGNLGHNVADLVAVEPHRDDSPAIVTQPNPQATEPTAGLFNQAFFSKIYIDHDHTRDGTVRHTRSSSA